MAGPLYARYIPPKITQQGKAHLNSSTNASHNNGRAEPGIKREKIQNDLQPVKADKKDNNHSKKRKASHQHEGADELVKHHEENTPLENLQSSRKRPRKERKQVKEFEDSVSASTAHEKGEDDEQNKSNIGGVEETQIINGNASDSATIQENKQKSGKSKKKKKNLADETSAEALETEKDSDKGKIKHSAVLSKFEKSIRDQPKHQKTDTKTEHVLEHDLVPIPVPSPAAESEVPSPFPTLPSWLSTPVKLSPVNRSPFDLLQLETDLVSKLRQKGIVDSLPIQSGLLPLLLPTPSQHPGDLCVSAATGSGKTLSYVLPIAQSLSTDVPTQLRALIVVPTRELVDQVREAAEMCTTGTPLRIGVAVGSKTLAMEQSSLVEKRRKYDPMAYRLLKEKLEKKMRFEIDSDDELDEDNESSLEDSDPSKALLDLLPDHVPHYESKVDILIATPGRLVEHIKATKGFSLAHLSWLIIDEADRLLDASFQEWVEILISAVESDAEVRNASLPSFRIIDCVKPQPVRKVLLSATMTRDLDKLGSLHLNNPRMILLEGHGDKESTHDEPNSTDLPPSLKQFGVPADDGSEKPLYLLALLSTVLIDDSATGASEEHISSSSEDSSSSDEESTSVSSPPAKKIKSNPLNLRSNALIFTASTEAAHRLMRLLVRMKPEYEPLLATITKSSASRKTQKTLSAFRSGNLRILIATDRASRGLDIPNLENVINYDIPHSINIYIHRVGRTARAGRKGTAWTLIENREAAWFWKQLAKSTEIHTTNGGITRTRVDLSIAGPEAKGQYTRALAELEKEVRDHGTERER